MKGENSRLNKASIERILDAVREGPAPRGVDQAGLADALGCIDLASLQEDLESARAWYEDAVVLYDNTLARARESKLKTARKAAETIARMDDDCWNLLEGTRCIFNPSFPYREDPRDTARRLIQDIDLTLRPRPRPKDFAPEIDGDGLFASGSPFKRFAGRRLVAVFKKYLPGIRVGYTKTEGGVDQPYIRFAERTLIELGINNHGIPYMRNSIADALTDSQKGRLRPRKTKHDRAKRRRRTSGKI